MTGLTEGAEDIKHRQRRDEAEFRGFGNGDIGTQH
jgi:hypothetical protein